MESYKVFVLPSLLGSGKRLDASNPQAAARKYVKFFVGRDLNLERLYPPARKLKPHTVYAVTATVEDRITNEYTEVLVYFETDATGTRLDRVRNAGVPAILLE